MNLDPVYWFFWMAFNLQSKICWFIVPAHSSSVFEPQVFSRYNCSYVGRPMRALQQRILQQSSHTGVPLTLQTASAIWHHCYSYKHQWKDFQMLTSASHKLGLTAIEALFTSRMKPELSIFSMSFHYTLKLKWSCNSSALLFFRGWRFWISSM